MTLSVLITQVIIGFWSGICNFYLKAAYFSIKAKDKLNREKVSLAYFRLLSFNKDMEKKTSN